MGESWPRVARGVGAVQEAIGIYGPLVEQLPEVFGSELWSAFHTLADGGAEDELGL